MTAEQVFAAALQGASGLNGIALFQAIAVRVCDADLARAWLMARLKDVAGGGTALPPGRADGVLQSLVLFDDSRAQLSLAMVSARDWRRKRDTRPEGPDIIGFADGWTRILFLVAPDCAVQKFVFDGRQALPQPIAPILPGQAVNLDNASEALRFARLGGDIVMLRLLVRDPGLGLAVECDAATGAVLRTRQAQAHEGRTQMIVSLLRSLGRRDAVQVIAEALPKWPPYLRWHGVREAMATDSSTGLRLLAAMARDDGDAGLRALADRTRANLVARYPLLAELA